MQDQVVALCRCAKSCAQALVGMLVHEDAAETIKIEDHNLHKVCAEYVNASAASIPTLYY